MSDLARLGLRTTKEEEKIATTSLSLVHDFDFILSQFVLLENYSE